MRKLLFLITLSITFLANNVSAKRVIRYPMFDNSQTPEFKIDSICITNKETLVYFHYDNREPAAYWINISPETYIKDDKGNKHHILSLENIAKGPERTYILDKKEWNCIIHFPRIKSNTIDFIEDESEISFNIYGIDLTKDGEFGGYVDFVDLNRKLQLADFYFTAKNYEKYIELATPLLTPIRSSFGKDMVIDIIQNLIDSHVLTANKNADYDEYIIEYRKLCKKNGWPNDLNCSPQLVSEMVQTSNTMYELFFQEKYEAACSVMLDYLSKARLIYDENDSIIADAEGMLFTIYKQLSDIDNAIIWGQKSLDDFNKIKNTGQTYQMVLQSMAFIYADIGNIEMADKCYSELYKIQETTGNKYTFQHAQIGYLWGSMLQINKNKKSTHILRDAYKLYDSPKMVIDSLYKSITHALSMGYREIDDNIPESIKTWEHAVQNIKCRAGNNTLYFNTIVGLAERCRETGSVGKATEYIYELTKEIQSQKFTIDHVKGLTTFANILRDIGDKNQSIGVYKQINNIYESSNFTNGLDYSYFLLDLASAYEDFQDTIECVNICKNIIDHTCIHESDGLFEDHIKLGAKLMLARMYQDNDPMCSATLCAEVVQFDNNTDELILSTKESAMVQLKGLYISHPDNHAVKQIYTHLSSSNISSKQADVLLNLLQFIKNASTKSHSTQETFINQGRCLVQDVEFDKKFDHFKETTLFNMLFLTEKQREIYFNSAIKKINYLKLFYISDILGDEKLNGIIYDYLLLIKSILLEFSNELSDIIYNSNDKELIKLYEEIQHHYDNYDEEMIESYEREIIKKTRNVSDFTKNLKINWKDIKTTLKENEVALEFLTDSSNGLNEYCVLILRNNWDYPKLLDLTYVEVAIEKWGLERMSNIWNILMNKEYVKRGDTVFMSGAGVFQTKYFEHLEISPGVLFSDICNVVRLTSTREIVKQRSTYEKINRSITLFGGLDYDNNENTTPNHEVLDTELFRGEGDERYRSGFEKLAYSQIEIDSIQNIAKNNKFKCREYRGKYGTEQEVRNISGKDIGILHFATHGLYYPESHPKVISNSPYQQLFNNGNCLNRSFLVMSGGNALPQHKCVTSSDCDGLLTAAEISHINLHSVGLVVLSTCQSAKGDISNEGVLGLQYGFKKAGVKSILMSLDNIDDKATQILMVEFYRNLLSGKSKHDSLRDAQRFLRTTENGKYRDPKYWASFILLDAID